MINAGVLKKKKIGRRATHSKAGDVTVLVILLIIAFFMLLPFVYSIVQSIKPMEEFFIFPPKFFVNNPTSENYYMLTQITNNLWVPFGRYVFNSIFVTVVGTVLNVFICSLAAFPLAKYKFPLKKFLNKLVEYALLFTAPVVAIARYVIIAKLNMINTYWALIMPAVAAPLGLFLMKNFMTQLPDECLDSAKIDGAGTFQIYLHVAMPNCKPAWLTLLIFAFQGLWSATGGSYIYNEDLKLLPTVLSQIVTSGTARAPIGAASAVLLMIPPAITFIIVQSNVLETMAHSGIK